MLKKKKPDGLDQAWAFESIARLNMTNISNTYFTNNKPIVVKEQMAQQKQIQATQSWYEPALHTLEQMLEVRRANLRKRNGDENQAAVTREEFMEHLHDLNGMQLWQAAELVSSLKRAGKIICFGRFIQMDEQGGEE